MKQDRTAPPMPDLVQREFTAPMPGLKFVGDFTCSPTAEGWLYLATVIDLCTREVVGWPIAGLRGRTYSGQRDLPFRPRIAI
jgi:transposase InsO family protein